MRYATAVSLLTLAVSACAAELRVGVFTLFRPTRLLVRPAEPAVVDGRLLPAGELMLIDHAPVRLTGLDGGDLVFALSIPGRIERRYHGTLEVIAESGFLVPVVKVGRETAVEAALAAELPEDAPAEALRALAVVIRSYYAAGRRHAHFDFCDTTHCQFFRPPPLPEHPASRAARATQNLVLTYRGAPFAPYYSAACGGRTRIPAELGLPVPDYPYRAVSCPSCRRDEPLWERRIPYALAAGLLNAPSEPLRLRIARELGWSALPGNGYTVRRDGDFLVFGGSGSGHGIGLCQHGAMALAGDGVGWRDIIAKYLPGTAIVLQH
ncbi:MAG TPA: SpoIID/LytB domain-containing protein [Bryobacteraceae bacterium]|nr:SpoIID/LytB domain-containing protein [Bryobacteraceae bacterium]